MPHENRNNQLTSLGRGIEAFDFTVRLEPSPSGELYSTVSTHELIDDGRHPGLISRIFSRKTSAVQNEVSAADSPIMDAVPTYSMTEMAVSLPQSCTVTPEAAEKLLMNLAGPSTPTAFEVVSTDKEISLQFAIKNSSADRATAHIKGFFPECQIVEAPYNLRKLIQTNKKAESLVIDFGLKRSALLSLNTSRSFDPDPLLGLIGAVSNLRKGELCVLQVLFQSTLQNWKEVLTRNLKRASPHESNQLMTSSKEKFSRPLLCCVVRLYVLASSRERAVDIARGFSGTIQTLASSNGNELVALSQPSVPMELLTQSVINRTSYRTAMLLNSVELAGLVHLPSASVICSKLIRNNKKTKAAPENSGDSILTLGHNVHDGISKPVGISAEQLTRHIFVCGATGTGKSVFLCNSIRQLVENKFGCAVIDVAGDLIDDIISFIPYNRLNDVILFDASSEHTIGFNPLQAFTEAEKHLLSSDLVGILKRYSTAWGALMEAAISHAVNAFLYNSVKGNLFDLKRFLIEKDFRANILQTVEDESTRYFWEKESFGINAKSLSSVLIRLDSFLRHPLIRNIVCAKESKLNFREIMDSGKIFLIKVSQGEIGQENASLLGSLLLSKFHQIALSRQNTDAKNRKLFVIAADEIQNYLSPSLGLSFAESRKFGVGIIAGTQSFRILQNSDANTAESILANSFTRICFRLGDDDAKRFSQGFSSFSAEDLQKLSVGHAIARIERADFDFNLETFPMTPIDPETARRRKQEVVTRSRVAYGKPKETLEQEKSEKIQSPISTDRPDTIIQLQGETNDGVSEQVYAETLQPTLIRQKENFGRAGKHHQELQAVIKRIAESYGFKVVIEQSVLDGLGRVDVSLEKEGLKIACEVCVTTSHYEITNILKCLSAGYDFVCVVVSNYKKIPLLKSKINSEIPMEHHEKVKVFSITVLLSFLREVGQPEEAIKTKAKKPAGQRLNFNEACEFFGVTPSTLYRWVREGRVPFYRPGREYQFDRDELVLIGKHDLSGKRKATVKLSPLRIDKTSPKGKKEQNSRYRKLLKLD